jgi:hypothetical protein
VSVVTASPRTYVPRTLPVVAVDAHVRELAAAGATVRGIAEAAGVPASVVSRVLSRQQARVRPGTVQRLLAVSIEDVMARPLPSGFVPAVGARRRIAALLALGWRHEDISAHAGGIQSGTVLHQVGGLVTRATHDSITRAYDQLAMTAGPSERTRRRARAAGYPPPLAWDDDALDRPDSDPTSAAASIRDDTSTAGRRRLTDLVEDAAWMATTGTGLTEAARRLYLAPDSLTRQLERAARHDLTAQLRRNERP